MKDDPVRHSSGADDEKDTDKLERDGARQPC